MPVDQRKTRQAPGDAAVNPNEGKQSSDNKADAQPNENKMNADSVDQNKVEQTNENNKPPVEDKKIEEKKFNVSFCICFYMSSYSGNKHLVCVCF